MLFVISGVNPNLFGGGGKVYRLDSLIQIKRYSRPLYFLLGGPRERRHCLSSTIHIEQLHWLTIQWRIKLPVSQKDDFLRVKLGITINTYPRYTAVITTDMTSPHPTLSPFPCAGQLLVSEAVRGAQTSSRHRHRLKNRPTSVTNR